MNVAVKVSSDVTYLFITLIGKFEFKKQMGQIFHSVYSIMCNENKPKPCQHYINQVNFVTWYSIPSHNNNLHK